MHINTASEQHFFFFQMGKGLNLNKQEKETILQLLKPVWN